MNKKFIKLKRIQSINKLSYLINHKIQKSFKIAYFVKKFTEIMNIIFNFFCIVISHAKIEKISFNTLIYSNYYKYVMK